MKFLYILLFTGVVSAAPVPPQVPDNPVGVTGLGIKIDSHQVYELYDQDYYKTGLVFGDVILTINGNTYEESWDFKEQLLLYRPGAVIKLEIVRNGKRMTLPVKLLTEKRD